MIYSKELNLVILNYCLWENNWCKYCRVSCCPPVSCSTMAPLNPSLQTPPYEAPYLLWDHIGVWAFRNLSLSIKSVVPVEINVSILQSLVLSPGDLLYYGGVEWINIADFLGKIKKGLELHAMCFVFKTAVVFLCKERIKHKKSFIVSVLNIRKVLLFLLCFSKRVLLKEKPLFL